MKKKYSISTNKFLYELFNFTFEDEEIKCKKEYINKTWRDLYYIEFIYESSKNSSFKVKVSSLEKEKLRFTIYEKMIYLILINNARQSSDENYFISMRKIRSIRGLKDNSLSTYNCYKNALDRLVVKQISLVPLSNSNNYKMKMVNCELLTINNEKFTKNRLSEFNYSFNELENSFVKNTQSITTMYNPFSIIFKKYYSFQISLHLLRMIALNRKTKSSSREYSFKLILKHIYKVDNKGFIEKQSYYDYLASAKNKQSEILRKSYDDIESILKKFVKYEIIDSFSITKRRTFKYLKDDEVKIKINFIG